MRTTKDPCNNCGSTTWYYFRTRYTDKEEVIRGCSDCSNGPTPKSSPDVYFNPSKGSDQTDPNLCRRNGIPIPFSSKREKAAILKQKGIREAGDKIHGSRNFDKTSSKQWDQ